MNSSLAILLDTGKFCLRPWQAVAKRSATRAVARYGFRFWMLGTASS
jgi:hypothetical protein